MNLLRKLLSFAALICFLLTTNGAEAQTIKAERGFDDQIGATFSMMEDLKRRVTNSVQNLNQAETDFLLDSMANSPGAMILHLAAVEAYYQVYTFENRGFNAAEKAKWELALNLGADAREELRGKPMQYYLDIWDEVRAESKRLLKSKEDDWLKEKVNGTSMNNYWAWYHVMEHQANHMGQIRLILKRIP